MQKITLISLKFLSVIMLMLSCSTRMSFGYELNKNIVYYDGFIEGYLYKEIEDWSIICEVKNNDRCLLTQFLEIQIDESTQTFLVLFPPCRKIMLSSPHPARGPQIMWRIASVWV